MLKRNNKINKNFVDTKHFDRENHNYFFFNVTFSNRHRQQQQKRVNFYGLSIIDNNHRQT